MSHPQPQHRFLNTIQETAALLAISERTVRRLISNGDLKPVRANGRVLIARKSLEEFIERGGTQG